jgi:hypothetical protein
MCSIARHGNGRAWLQVPRGAAKTTRWRRGGRRSRQRGEVTVALFGLDDDERTRLALNLRRWRFKDRWAYPASVWRCQQDHDNAADG